MPSNPIVTKQGWIEARRALLAKEKELTRLRFDPPLLGDDGI